MPETSSILRYVPPRQLKIAAIVVLCVAAVIVTLGLISRVRANQNITQWTNAQAIPIVAVIMPSNVRPNNVLTLPGTIQAFYTAPVFARVTGYLKAWYTDIGAKVKSGQTLADIVTPDLDQQVVAARGNLAVAIANQKLAAITDSRMEALFAENAISAEMRDQSVGALDADIAATEAARAIWGSW